MGVVLVELQSEGRKREKERERGQTERGRREREGLRYQKWRMRMAGMRPDIAAACTGVVPCVSPSERLQPSV